MLTIENLARFQFAMTTIFHFFFVPLSVGMVLMTAIMETIYVKLVMKMEKTHEIFLDLLCSYPCSRGSNRYYSRISIWNELVGIFSLRWGYFWRAFGC